MADIVLTVRQLRAFGRDMVLCGFVHTALSVRLRADRTSRPRSGVDALSREGSRRALRHGPCTLARAARLWQDDAVGPRAHRRLVGRLQDRARVRTRVARPGRATSSRLEPIGRWVQLNRSGRAAVNCLPPLRPPFPSSSPPHELPRDGGDVADNLRLTTTTARSRRQPRSGRV